MRQEGLSTVHLTSTIRKADSVEALAEASRMLPRLQMQLVNMGADLEHVGNAVSAVTDALTVRLIELREAEIGPPPVPYAWICAGSQARREQTSHSDQDNGLIISDEMQPEHADWFEDLARFVNDGLNACGFIYCPGNVMASNPEWRQTESVWQGYFDRWINQPEPKALMLSSIFFDLRVVHGERRLLSNRCPPWRAKRRRVVPGSREATRDTRRAEGAKGDPKGASERGVQSYGRPVCSRNELAMLWRNAG